ncbi:drug/metabolite transporter (DMT)-like permease [Microbacterium sp. W4I4]|uniref:DMT family transporter n=1 Tax=Microbacterium sp. W4I4 TaxID=3042295 RepID=UPI00278097C0|nr:DMT family transporter [Microbacterium sp. W4I4]MDQ0615159.1 drug/metabolite transporter (DMT)-like permease [Microbacterium sp. W4I4]
MNRSGDRRTIVIFLLTGFIWGSGFLFIRVAVAELSPVEFVFARTALACAVLALVMLVTRRHWPTGFDVWRRIATLGIVGCAVPFLFYAWAGQRIPSGLSSIYNAAVPVATALVTLIAMRQERLGGRKLLAIAVGAIGIVVVLQPWRLDASDFDLGGQLACIGAVLGLGFAFSYTRKAISPLGLDPIGVAMGQMLVCAVVVGGVVPFTSTGVPAVSPAAIGSVLASGVFATGIAYIWNFQIIERWGAASASMVTYVTTLVGVAAGIIVLHEPMAIHHLIGAAIVLIGVGIGVQGSRGTVGLGPAAPG